MSVLSQGQCAKREQKYAAEGQISNESNSYVRPTFGRTLYSINNRSKNHLVGWLRADNPHRPDAPQKLARVNAGLGLLLEVFVLHLLLHLRHHLHLVLWADALGWLGALDGNRIGLTHKNRWKLNFKTCKSLPESIQLLLASQPGIETGDLRDVSWCSSPATSASPSFSLYCSPSSFTSFCFSDPLGAPAVVPTNKMTTIAWKMRKVSFVFPLERQDLDHGIWLLSSLLWTEKVRPLGQAKGAN